MLLGIILGIVCFGVLHLLLVIFYTFSLSVLFSEVSKPERFSGDNIIYKPIGESVPDMVYLGSLSNFNLTYAWVQDKCVPLVREITFENGEVRSLVIVLHTHIHTSRIF